MPDEPPFPVSAVAAARHCFDVAVPVGPHQPAHHDFLRRLPMNGQETALAVARQTLDEFDQHRPAGLSRVEMAFWLGQLSHAIRSLTVEADEPEQGKELSQPSYAVTIGGVTWSIAAIPGQQDLIALRHSPTEGGHYVAFRHEEGRWMQWVDLWPSLGSAVVALGTSLERVQLDRGMLSALLDDAAGIEPEGAAKPSACWCAEPGRTEEEMYQCPAGDAGEECLAHDYLATGGRLSLRGSERHPTRYPQPDLSDLREAQEAAAKTAAEGGAL